MSRKKTVAKNSFFMFLDRILRGLLLMALTIIVARTVGVKDFGLYSLALTLGGLFRTICDFGIGLKCSYEIARDRTGAARIFSQGLVLRSLIGAAGLLLAVVLVRVYPERFHVALIVSAVAALMFGYIEYANSVFNGSEQMAYVPLNLVVYMSLVFVAVGGMLLLGIRSVPWLLSGHLLAGILGMGFAGYLLFRHQVVHWIPPRWPDIRQLFIASVPFGLFILSDIIYFHTDIVVLSFLQGERAVGLYQAAYKIIQLVETIPGILVIALFPTISRMHNEKPEAIPGVLLACWRYFLSISLVLAAGAGLLANDIIHILYRDAFASSGPVLMLLAVILPFRYIILLFGIALSAGGNQQKRMAMVGITALLNLGLNLWWVPRWGILGSAGASVVSAAVLAGSFIYQMRAALGFRRLAEQAWRPVVAAAVMSGALLALREHWPLLALIPVGGVVYAVCLLGLGGVSSADWGFLRSLLAVKIVAAERTDDHLMES